MAELGSRKQKLKLSAHKLLASYRWFGKLISKSKLISKRMANQAGGVEAERLMGLFFDILREAEERNYYDSPGRQTTLEEERSMDVLYRTSRAMYGDVSGVGVTPLMMQWLGGYMSGCGHGDTRIPQLYQIATLRCRNYGKQLAFRQRNPRRRQGSP